MILDCRGKQLDLSIPRVMGVLNITPDSFSDGGDYLSVNKACDHAFQMVEQGAAVIDIGGESTRPGAEAVSADQEADRVLPVIEALRDISVPVSIDTRKPDVMRVAVAAGAGMINDVNALREEGALQVAASANVPVCLMHMQGDPGTMQNAPGYTDVIAEVRGFLEQRVVVCLAAGIRREHLLVDPGFGFGKTDEHNLSLLARLEEFTALGLPLLVGLSRKSMIGRLLGLEVNERMVASVALAIMAVERGALLVRAHDVAETQQALQLYGMMHTRRQRLEKQ